MPSTITTTGRRRRSGATRKGEGPLPGWIWLLLGMGLGLVVALLIYLLQYTMEDSVDAATGKTTPPAEQTIETVEPDPAPAEEGTPVIQPAEEAPEERRRFDFYSLLPDLEVVIPEREQPVAPERRPPPETAVEPEAGVRYLMQAGSFRSHADADRMKASLALLGVESRIESVTIEDGGRWHRVRIGPIDDFERMQTIHTRLADNDIDVMVIEVRE
jgi:cell division protein FtsN